MNIYLQLTRYLNLEKVLPCYKLTVTVSCLHTIRCLQRNGHLPPKSDIFKSYAAYPQFIGKVFFKLYLLLVFSFL